MESFKQFKERFQKSIKIAHYTLLALGCYQTFEIVKSIVEAF